MTFAFWRAKDPPARRDSAAPKSRSRGDGPEAEEPATLRVRARRRLIGAAALLLAAAIGVPLLLDPAPRAPDDSIPIDIPSERQTFTPRLSLPPVPDPGQVPVAPPPDLPVADADKGKGAETVPPSGGGEAAKAASAAGDGKGAATEDRGARPAEPAPRRVEEKKTPEPVRAKVGRIVLQAAALSTEGAAQDLSERLRKAGFAPFTERVETADGVRFRVRVGPYATRDEAQRAQARLRSLGVSATLVSA
jgi:DedD protein